MSDALFEMEPTYCPTCGRLLSLTGGCAWCENELPALPYAGTSGWSGSDTSKARAVTADSNGTTSKRQADTIRLLAASGAEGVTVVELRQRYGWHHGQASGVLSVLHKEGVIARLHESRDRCKVYALPEFVNGRETEPHGRKPRAANPDPVPVHSPDGTYPSAVLSESDIRNCDECGSSPGFHTFFCSKRVV